MYDDVIMMTLINDHDKNKRLVFCFNTREMRTFYTVRNGEGSWSFKEFDDALNFFSVVI